jgi:hypothetical protein
MTNSELHELTNDSRCNMMFSAIPNVNSVFPGQGGSKADAQNFTLCNSWRSGHPVAQCSEPTFIAPLARSWPTPLDLASSLRYLFEIVSGRELSWNDNSVINYYTSLFFLLLSRCWQKSAQSCWAIVFGPAKRNVPCPTNSILSEKLAIKRRKCWKAFSIFSHP